MEDVRHRRSLAAAALKKPQDAGFCDMLSRKREESGKYLIPFHCDLMWGRGDRRFGGKGDKKKRAWCELCIAEYRRERIVDHASSLDVEARRKYLKGHKEDSSSYKYQPARDHYNLNIEL